MKKLILTFLLILSFSGYSQTTTKKYNNLMERYEYYNSSGVMIGYEEYNSLMEQWEYTDLSEKSNSRVHDYGEPVSTFDSDLAFKVLQAKQNRYDNMSNAEKARLRASREYKRKKRYVSNRADKHIRKWLKEDARNEKKDKKKTSRNYRKIKNKEKVGLPKLDDGWYDVYSKIDNLLLERTIRVENGRITKYIGGDNMEINVLNTTKLRNGNYTLNLLLMKENFDTEIIIVDNRKDKKPEYKKPTQITFYTKSNKINGQIDFLIKGENGYHVLPSIKHYLEEDPSCGQNEYVSTMILPAGSYEYYAFSETEFWTNNLILYENYCKKIELTKKY